VPITLDFVGRGEERTVEGSEKRGMLEKETMGRCPPNKDPSLLPLLSPALRLQQGDL
jgi:hypothetical protein